MTVTDMAAYRELSDADARTAARADFRADPSLSGAAVGKRYGRSDEWGRKQKRWVERNGTPSRAGTRTGAKPSRSTKPTGPMHGPPVPPAQPAAAAEPAVVEPVPLPTGRWVRYVQVAGVVVVAAVAAVISYTHMRHLALLAGEGWRADILPLSVDGMMVVASMNALERRRAGKRAWLAWAGLLLGLGASFAANVAAAQPTLVGRLVAAWPPVALLVALELLLHRGDDQ